MNKLPLKSLTSLQIAFCLFTGIAVGLVWHLEAALFAVLGGLTVVIANFWYLWRLYSIALGADTAKVLAAYHRAEVGKILVFVLLLGCLLAIVRPISSSDALLMNLLLGSFLINSVFVTFSNLRGVKNWLATLSD